MGVNNSGTEFDYDGYLVFNGIYSTSVLDTDFDLHEIVSENMPDFSVGSPDAPSRGYRTLDFIEHASDSPEVSPSLEEHVEHVRGIRYEYEEWENGETYQEGQIKQDDVRQTDSFDVYWSFPDYLFIKGDKTEAKKAKELLGYELDQYIKVDEIEFDPDFLLWIFSQYKNSSGLGEGITASMLTDCEIEGEQRDRFGRRNKVDGSTDVTKSTTALMGILRAKSLTSLEGVFELSGNFISAEIASEGRVHIKAEKGISGESKVRRMALSLHFLDSLVSLYDKWEDLPPKDRYPPEEFFREIYEECKREGAEVTFPVDDVIKTYRNKGNRQKYKQRQSGLDEY